MISSQKKKGAPTPSSEILVALPNANNPKKYTTYLGLVDSGSSRSLIDKKLVAKENKQVQLQPIKWETATGKLLTQGKVEIQHCRLPQFTTNVTLPLPFTCLKKAKTISMTSSLAEISCQPLVWTFIIVSPTLHGTIFLLPWSLVGVGLKKKFQP